MADIIGQAAAIGAALVWSSSSFMFTTAAQRIGSVQLNIDRMIVASILLLATILAFRIDYTWNGEQFLLLTASGIAGLVIGDSFLFKAFKEIGPRLGLLIMSVNPAVASILAFIFIGEKLSWIQIAGISLAIGGVVLVIYGKQDVKSFKFKVTKIGVISATLGAVGQASGLMLAKMANNVSEIDFFAATLIRLATAVIILVPLAAAFKKVKNPIKVYSRDRKTFGIVLLGSVLGPYIGITLSFIAVVYAEVGVAATLMATTPIIMLPLSRIIHKEKLRPASIIGAFITVGGVALLFLE